MQMPVKATTEPAIVAGALAARVRENIDVCLSAIGVDAVGNAMRAICFARVYLEVKLHCAVYTFAPCVATSGSSKYHSHNCVTITLQDNGLDIKAMPEFTHVTKDGMQMSGLLFNIIVEKAV